MAYGDYSLSAVKHLLEAVFHCTQMNSGQNTHHNHPMKIPRPDIPALQISACLVCSFCSAHMMVFELDIRKKDLS